MIKQTPNTDFQVAPFSLDPCKYCKNKSLLSILVKNRILVKKTAIEVSESLGSCVHSTCTRMSINNHGSQPAPERGAQRTAMGRKPSLVLKSSSIA